MIAAPDTPTGPPAEPGGESCHACGDPLAADQRYCLECGRAEATPGISSSTCARGPPSRTSKLALRWLRRRARAREWTPLSC